jgi:hypothetical protein
MVSLKRMMMDLCTKDMHYIEESLEEQGSMGGCETVGPDEFLDDATNSLTGKLKTYCPSLFLSSLCGNEITWKNQFCYIKFSSVVSEKVVDPIDKGASICSVDRTMPQSFNDSVVSVPIASSDPSSLDLNTQSLPSPILPASDLSLVSVVDSLIPSLRENTSLIPLQTFWGSEVYINWAVTLVVT